MNEKSDNPKKVDRLLGDEWEDWSGELDESATWRETAGLFTVFGGAALVLLIAIAAAAVWLVEPRLAQFGDGVMWAVRVAAAVLALTAVVTAALVAGTVFTGRPVLVRGRYGQVLAARILPVAIAIGRRLGIHRDRLGNSFVAFSNAIVRAQGRPVKGRTIILMPRCLSPELKAEIKAIGERSGVGVHIATGGGQARKIIREHRPAGVIGIACERDLISGLRDVAPKMPTMGVANQRPEGPCRNTVIDLDDLRDAIRTMTGKNFD